MWIDGRDPHLTTTPPATPPQRVTCWTLNAQWRTRGRLPHPTTPPPHYTTRLHPTPPLQPPPPDAATWHLQRGCSCGTRYHHTAHAARRCFSPRCAYRYAFYAAALAHTWLRARRRGWAARCSKHCLPATTHTPTVVPVCSLPTPRAAPCHYWLRRTHLACAHNARRCARVTHRRSSVLRQPAFVAVTLQLVMDVVALPPPWFFTGCEPVVGRSSASSPPHRLDRG